MTTADDIEPLSLQERAVLARLGTRASRTEPPPEAFAAYCEGHADADEQHRVEQALAADPLWRRAVVALRAAQAEPATAGELARAHALLSPRRDPSLRRRGRLQAWFGPAPVIAAAAIIIAIAAGSLLGTGLGTAARAAETVTLTHFTFDWI